MSRPITRSLNTLRYLALVPLICLGIISILASGSSGSNNDPPVADAGADKTSGVQVGDAVLLDGSASSDPDGDALTYSWSLMTVPAGSAATLSNPTSAQPSFIADKPGTYTAWLTVNDGFIDSAVDEVAITVVMPPPTVTITTPENLSVVTATTVTVTGTVDDPNATLTVNGNATTNNNGNYTADGVDLEDGTSNTVTVVGKNDTGEGSASVEVIVNTSENPALSITSPKRNFITGGTFPMGVPFPPLTPVTVTGVIRVYTSVLLGNAPSVNVNGVIASVTPQFFNSECSLLDLIPPFHCWKFEATIPLEQGNDTITAVGTDVHVPPRSTTVSIGGIVDYCRIGAYDSKSSTPGFFDPGVLALAGENHDIQSNRCHEIDGCSAPNVTQQCADDPMQCPEGISGTVLKIPAFGTILIGVPAFLLTATALPAKHNQAPTAFGRGAPPPDGIGNHPIEYFVHGDQSAFGLPCNRHDPCYQTCVPVAGLSEADRDLAWESAWHACNEHQHREMLDVCARAYPPKCPFTGLEIVKCPKYFEEKLFCTIFADTYFKGVETVSLGNPSGLERFKQRQTDYCAQ